MPVEGEDNLESPTEEANSAERDSFFNTDHLSTNLKNRAVRGGAITFVGQGAKFFLQLASTVVLARLLTPEQFGLVAMVAAFTGFILVFKDMGLSMATVQRASITHSQISTLFWINVIISLLLMLITAALTPVISWFYGEPRLTMITLALACAFILGGLTVQHQALLRRQMRFTALAAIDIIAMAVGVTTAIVSAVAGFGFWALVLMQLGTSLSTAIGVWVASGWRPGLPVRHSGVRSMLGFGGHLTGFHTVNYFARNVDKVLLGRYWGSSSVALYTKAYSLLLLPLSQITSPLSAVAVPTLSRLQSDPSRYRAYYRQGVGLTLMLGVPIVAFLFVAAKPVILILLGDQWLEAIPIFQILAPAALVGSTSAATGWVYVSLGHTDRQFRYGVAVALATVVGFVVGNHWGVMGVAAAYSIVTCLTRVPGILYCFHGTPLVFRDFFDISWRPILFSVVAAAGVLTAENWLSLELNAGLELLVAFVLFVTCYAALFLVAPNSSRPVQGILQLVTQLRSAT